MDQRNAESGSVALILSARSRDLLRNRFSADWRETYGEWQDVVDEIHALGSPEFLKALRADVSSLAGCAADDAVIVAAYGDIRFPRRDVKNWCAEFLVHLDRLDGIHR